MRILVLRTIAHNRIWEGNEPRCHYKNQAYEIIKTWEPNIINYTLEEMKYGIGIYTRQYFDYISPTGIKASTNTIQENKPSLLNLMSINNKSKSFIEDKSGIIRIAFELNKKYEEFDKGKMFELDNKLITQKIKELGHKPTTPYPSLCFTLNFKDVDNILNKFEVSIN